MNLKIYTLISSFRRFSILFTIVALIFGISSCTKHIREICLDCNNPPIDSIYTHNGLYVINEGNFNWANASISYIDLADTLVEQDMFARSNDNRSLGDVAQGMRIFNGLGYIIVNNSNKIEVVSLPELKSVRSITTGFNLPRNIQFIDSGKAYVTNLLKDISIIDLKTLTVTNTIPTANWTEGMVRYNNYVFVTCIGKYSSPNSERIARLLVVDCEQDKIIDSIESGKEPLGIVMDKRNKLWVLCTGGYDNYEAPSLFRVNPDLMIVEKTFHFLSVQDAPSRLCINSLGDTLYFLKNGVYQMPVASSAIPDVPVIPSNGHLFYGLGIDPSNGNIFVTDAVDYVQNGWVYRYDQINKTLLNGYKVGRIPSSFCFPKASESKR
ncbi:MAG: YncE family protein [Bacteroidetes bacterium]|nr:YncE family protein [Bacteroidota bacterium]